jgi:hypothetical protein
MVCKSSRDRKKSKSNLPAKKRYVATVLTKESLEAMTLSSPNIKVATVSEDSGSSQSSVTPNGSALLLSTFATPPQQGSVVRPSREQSITNDVALTQRALAMRNAEERLRVARSMLYHAYVGAIQQKQGNEGC